MISSETMIDKEPPELIHLLSGLCPSDVLIFFNHIFDEKAWRIKIKNLGVDVTYIMSTPKLEALFLAVAYTRELQLHLRDSEEGKCCRRGATYKNSWLYLYVCYIMTNYLNECIID